MEQYTYIHTYIWNKPAAKVFLTSTMAVPRYNDGIRYGDTIVPNFEIYTIVQNDYHIHIKYHSIYTVYHLKKQEVFHS